MSAWTTAVASPRFRVGASLLGLAIPFAWLWSVTTPSEQAVKIRNAWIAEMGTAGDFDWTPDQVPNGFRLERGGADPQFVASAGRVLAQPSRPAASAFEQGLEISRHLLQAGTRGGPIMADNATAYREIVEGGRGYCGDYTQVFNALALASGLAVREWGIAFDAFGSGHAFNEVYDAQRGKWVLVDSFHSLYFADPGTGEPLSVLEAHDRLLGIDKAHGVKVVPIVPEEFAFRSEAVAIDYYRRGMRQLFLWWGNNVFEYERNGLVRAAGHVSRSLEQATAIAVGVHPQIRIYPKGVSTRDVNALFDAGRDFVLALVACVVAMLVFGLQLLAEARRRRAGREAST